MKTEDLINFWVKGSGEDIKTAESLFRSKRYHHCLFFCRLFVEKILKALVAKATGKPAPYGHKLTKLAKLTEVGFTNEQLDLLDEITAFNIEARYNDYKFRFYKKATKNYTQAYFQRAKEVYLWLRKKV